MLSYKQWKSLNESILPSFNLGLGGPSKLGIIVQNAVDIEQENDPEILESKKKEKNPKVEVEVKEKDSKNKKCDGSKKCGKMSKKKMWSDNDDNYDTEDEEIEDEEEEEEDSDEDEGEDEDSDEDEGEDEDSDGDESEDEDSDEDEDEDEEKEDKGMKFSKKSKKKMLKGKQHKLDANKDGKIDAQDFKMLRKKKMGSDSIARQIDYHKEIGSDGLKNPAGPKKNISPQQSIAKSVDYHSSKNMKKKMKKEEAEMAWWNSVNGMISDPYQKFNDGWTEYQKADDLFVPIDLDNLSVAIREPGPGEVGFAPTGSLSGQLGLSLSEAAKWVYTSGQQGVALKGDDNKPKVFSSIDKAHDATESHGGKAVKVKDGWIVVKLLKVPSQEELKKTASFRSSEYDMPSKGDKEEAKRTVRQDQRAMKVGQKKKLAD